MRRCIAINSNLFRRSVLANGLSEEPLGSINASILAQQKIDSAALLINKAISERGIKVRIAREGIDSSERLGRYRWVVERMGSWLNNFRRLRIRYERSDDIQDRKS